MLHRSSFTVSRERDQDVFTGIDSLTSLVTAGMAVVIGLLVILAALSVHAPAWLIAVIAAAAVFAVLLSIGCRYRLAIGKNGIDLSQIRVWYLPTHRAHWLLDADIELYESWEAASPEGICIAARREPGGSDSECFGPQGEEQIRALYAAAVDSLARFRAAVLACPPTLRHRLLGPQVAALDIAGAARNPAHRLRQVTCVAPVRLGVLTIPAGSRLHLNGDEFLDPRRDDRLLKIELGAPLSVHGLIAQPGAELTLADDGAGPVVYTKNAFAREITIEGLSVRGDEFIGFGTDGALEGFTLARGATFAGFEVPAGSRFHRFGKWAKGLPTAWTCTLGGPLKLPEATLTEGESCEFSLNFARLVAISPRRDLALNDGQVQVRGGVLSIPVAPDGRVDVNACRKKSLLVRAAGGR